MKLRAWHKEAQEYRAIDRIDFDKNGRMDCITTRDLETGHDPWDDVIEAVELEPYSGVKDKNGVEIAVGDIIIVRDFAHPISSYLGKPLPPAPVVLRKGSFRMSGLKDGLGEEWALGNASILHEMEIVGNVHKNPELLEEEERQ